MTTKPAPRGARRLWAALSEPGAGLGYASLTAALCVTSHWEHANGTAMKLGWLAWAVPAMFALYLLAAINSGRPRDIALALVLELASTMIGGLGEHTEQEADPIPKVVRIAVLAVSAVLVIWRVDVVARHRPASAADPADLAAAPADPGPDPGRLLHEPAAPPADHRPTPAAPAEPPAAARPHLAAVPPMAADPLPNPDDAEAIRIYVENNWPLTLDAIHALFPEGTSRERARGLRRRTIEKMEATG